MRFPNAAASSRRGSRERCRRTSLFAPRPSMRPRLDTFESLEPRTCGPGLASVASRLEFVAKGAYSGQTRVGRSQAGEREVAYAGLACRHRRSGDGTVRGERRLRRRHQLRFGLDLVCRPGGFRPGGPQRDSEPASSPLPSFPVITPGSSNQVLGRTKTFLLHRRSRASLGRVGMFLVVEFEFHRDRTRRSRSLPSVVKSRRVICTCITEHVLCVSGDASRA